MAAIFESLVGTTVTGGILTLIAFAALPATKKLLPSKWNGRLLSAILVFFLLPVGAASAALYEKISTLFMSKPEFAAFLDDIPAPLDMPMFGGTQISPQNTTLLETILPALPVIWIIGMIVTLTFKFSQLIRFENMLAKSNGQITEAKTLDAFSRIKKELLISDSVSLCQNSGISTPMLMGLIRTRLLIPQINLNDEELELVLRHELTHHRNRDLWIKFIAMLASAIHWFNPCIYLLSSGLEHFLELACDADVVSEMNREERRIYGTTILTVLSRASFRQPQVYAAFSSNKKAMKGRLSAMLNGKKQSKKVVIFSILVLVFICVIGVGVSAAVQGDRHSTPKFDSFLWPTIGGYISSGVDTYPGHTGLDVAVTRGTPVYASAPGVVVKAIESEIGYGKHLMIKHNGGYQTLYAHCDSLAVSEGDIVKAGQVIATVGSSGNATGSHVHLEIRKNNKILNPEDFVNINNSPMTWPQE